MATPSIAAGRAAPRAAWSNLPVVALLALALLSLAALPGCEREPPPPTGQERTAAEAQEAAALYHQLRELGRLEQAELAGRNVLEKYPDTPAAAEVRQTYEALRAEVEGARESSRLSGLWIYHAVPEGDGTVYTATIHRDGDDTSVEVADDAQGLRLVLRRHPQWGQAVYLLVSGGDFDCAEDGCTVEVSFDDGEAEAWEATVSREGPLPALFVEDDERFIEAMQQARWVQFDPPLTPAATRPVRFEVGGFDRATWLGEPAGTAAPADPADAEPAEAQDAPDPET